MFVMNIVATVDFAPPTADLVYRRMRAAILDLTFLPGSALSESALVQRIGVSRTPIRQALQRLEQEQLVRIFPQRGTVVAPLDLQSFREAFFVRVSLETAAAREAAAHATHEDCTALRRETSLQRDAVVSGNHAEFFGLNEAFHRRLMALAGLGNVWSVVESAKVHLDRMRSAHLLLSGPYPLAPLVDEHDAIVDALDANDSNSADALMRNHLEKVLPRADLLRRRRPELFAWPSRGLRPDRAIADQPKMTAATKRRQPKTKGSKRP
jgi:DNA-binding GntR family transcriptional regulator